MNNTYIQNKLDELIETYRKENYSEYDVRMVAERLATDYHNHIVEKMYDHIENMYHPGTWEYNECNNFVGSFSDRLSLLQDTNPKEYESK